MSYVHNPIPQAFKKKNEENWIPFSIQVLFPVADICYS